MPRPRDFLVPDDQFGKQTTNITWRIPAALRSLSDGTPGGDELYGAVYQHLVGLAVEHARMKSGGQHKYQAMAETLGWYRQKLSSYLNGHTPMTLSNAAMLAALLSPNWLFPSGSDLSYTLRTAYTQAAATIPRGQRLVDPTRLGTTGDRAPTRTWPTPRHMTTPAAVTPDWVPDLHRAAMGLRMETEHLDDVTEDEVEFEIDWYDIERDDKNCFAGDLYDRLIHISIYDSTTWRADMAVPGTTKTIDGRFITRVLQRDPDNRPIRVYALRAIPRWVDYECDLWYARACEATVEWDDPAHPEVNWKWSLEADAVIAGKEGGYPTRSDE